MVLMNVYMTRGNEIFYSMLFVSIAVVACTGTGLNLFAFEHHKFVLMSCRDSPVPNYVKHHPWLSYLGKGLLQQWPWQKQGKGFVLGHYCLEKCQFKVARLSCQELMELGSMLFAVWITSQYLIRSPNARHYLTAQRGASLHPPKYKKISQIAKYPSIGVFCYY